MTDVFPHSWLPSMYIWEKLMPDSHKVMHIIHMIPSNVRPYQTLATQSPVGSSLRNYTQTGTIISSEQTFHLLYICDTRSDTAFNLQAV